MTEDIKLFKSGPHAAHTLTVVDQDDVSDLSNALIELRENERNRHIILTGLELDSIALQWLARRAPRIEHNHMGYTEPFKG